MAKKNKVSDAKPANAPFSRKAKRMEKKRARSSKGGDEDSDGEVPPMPEMTSQGAWDFSAATVKSGGSTKKAKKGGAGGSSDVGTVKLCPKGHMLWVSGTPHDEYMCDAAVVCSGEFLPTGSTLFGCRLCGMRCPPHNKERPHLLLSCHAALVHFITA